MITNIEKNGLVVTLIDQLHANGSWCDEAHVQKAAYFVEELCKVPLGFGFRLYKQSPFSFALQERLTGLRADGFLTLEITGLGGGPMIRATEDKDALLSRSQKVLDTHKKAIEFVASRLGAKPALDLACLATALMISRERGGDVDSRSKALVVLKPHMQLSAAVHTVETIDNLQTEYAEMGEEKIRKIV